MTALVVGAHNSLAQLLLLVAGSEKIRPDSVIGDRAWVQVLRLKGGGINTFSRKYLISNPVHVSGFEAYHGTRLKFKSANN